MKNPSCIVDMERHTITVNGSIVKMSSKEFSILSTLAQASGRVISRAKLLEIVWGYAESDSKAVFGRTVDQHISRCRRALRKHGAQGAIETVTNAGYRIRGVEIHNDKSITGKVDSIERVYGKKPGSWVRLFVADLLPTVEKGRMMTLA